MKKRCNLAKSTKLIIVIIAVLGVFVSVLAYLNREMMLERLEHLEIGTFMVSSGEKVFNISLQDLLSMSPSAIYTSPRGVRRDFTGVPLAAILEHLDIDHSQFRSIVFLSLDGFATAISIEEAMNADNTFIVFEEDGKALGTREEGGLGPYMVVMARDPFPNRWARYLMEIKLQE